MMRRNGYPLLSRIGHGHLKKFAATIKGCLKCSLQLTRCAIGVFISNMPCDLLFLDLMVNSFFI